MKKYAFGVDIGGTAIKLGLFESSGKLCDTWEIRTRLEADGGYILSDIKIALEQKLKEKMIDSNEIQGIGVGVPGPVGPDGMVYRCVNLGWGIFNVEQKLEAMTGFQVKAGNDANVAALGEMWQGGGEGCRSIVMVTLGTGVGGGVIIDGSIVSGNNGAAGEIGHIHARDGETRSCGCGKKGCLEQYASANGIARMTKQYLDAHTERASVLRSQANITAKDIFDAAKQDDGVACLMVEDTSRMLGKALAQIACVTNPEAFVIGGGMAKAGPMLIQSMQKYFQEYAFHAAEQTCFKEALLSNEAGIYGAVKLVLN